MQRIGAVFYALWGAMHPGIAVALLALAASGCLRESTQAGRPAVDAAPSWNSTHEPKHEGGPHMKETEAPQADRIGTLPTDVGIAIGQPAPDVVLHDAEDHEVRLHELVAKGPILLVFYRGGWCPFCNFQIHELTAAYPEYERRGVTPVAVSVDRIEEAAKTRATYTIPFPVLSDTDLAAHRAFGVVHQVDEAEVAKLKGFGLDIERSSGRSHHVIAIPSIFIIDRSGIVRWAHADRDYKVRPSTAQILAAITEIRLPNAPEQATPPAKTVEPTHGQGDR